MRETPAGVQALPAAGRCSSPRAFTVLRAAAQGCTGLRQGWLCQVWADRYAIAVGQLARWLLLLQGRSKSAHKCTASLGCVLQVAGSAGLLQGLPRSRLLQQRCNGLLLAALLAAIALLAGAGRGQAPLLYPGSPACSETHLLGHAQSNHAPNKAQAALATQSWQRLQAFVQWFGCTYT